MHNLLKPLSWPGRVVDLQSDLSAAAAQSSQQVLYDSHFILKQNNIQRWNFTKTLVCGEKRELLDNG